MLLRQSKHAADLLDVQRHEIKISKGDLALSKVHQVGAALTAEHVRQEATAEPCSSSPLCSLRLGHLTSILEVQHGVNDLLILLA